MKEKRSGFDVKAATKLLNRVFRYMLHYYAVPFVLCRYTATNALIAFAARQRIANY